MKSNRRYIPRKKRLFQCFFLFVAFLLCWFLLGRATSSRNQVRVITLPIAFSYFEGHETSAIRVGCYNIAHGRGGMYDATNWAGGNRKEKIARLKKISALLKNDSLDIVVLNEVDFSCIWSGHINQAQCIAIHGGYPYVLEQRNLDMGLPFVNVRFGNAILSKFPITDVTFLDYPNPSEIAEIFTGGYKEGVVGTIVLPDSNKINVVAVHLCVSSEPIRIASVQKILDFQRQSPLPTIIMGDFNATPSKYIPKRAITKKNTIDLLLAHNDLMTFIPAHQIKSEHFTFPSMNPSRLIDWIFVSKQWQIKKHRVVSTHLSDHLPVVALLTLQPMLNDVHIPQPSLD